MNKVYYKNSQDMSEVSNNSVDLVVTSPPYFNVKDYSKSGRSTGEIQHSEKKQNQIGDINDYKTFIAELLKVWVECERVLKPNGKLAINVPLMPMLKVEYPDRHNRVIFDLNSDIQQSIIWRPDTKIHLMNTFIWRRTNARKGLMFGSYPYPTNFYSQNTCEFVAVYVKDRKPNTPLSLIHISEPTRPY